MTISPLRLFAALSLFLSTSAAAAVAVEDLAQLAPDADPQVLALALRARQCALAHGDIAADDRLAVIDYSRPSTQKRLWVFELQPARLLYAEHVA